LTYYLHNKQNNKKETEVTEKYRSILRGGSQLTAYSGVRGPNFTKLVEDIG